MRRRINEENKYLSILLMNPISWFVDSKENWISEYKDNPCIFDEGEQEEVKVSWEVWAEHLIEVELNENGDYVEV